MTMATKQEIFKEKLAAYLLRNKAEKSRILDSVCTITGHTRKAAICRFKTLQVRHASFQDRRGRPRKYGTEVVAALKELWEISGRICAERLHPQLGEYISVLKRDRMWRHNESTTALLFEASLGTLKERMRKFENIRKGKGHGTTKPSDLKEIIPVRRGPWDKPPPGYGEVDTVAHCGITIAGDFCYTVQYTDVATAWTCLSGQWNKGQEETRQSIAMMEKRLPFSLLGIDPDSGSEFINWHLKEWCDAHHIQMTRSRPYMKNDHARIEQKNYANVRHVVGYARFDTRAQTTILNELYPVLEDYLNFFIPSMMCSEKVRIQGKTKRRYKTAQTAYTRVLAHPVIGEDIKEKLRMRYATLNSKILRGKIDRILSELFKTTSRLRY